MKLPVAFGGPKTHLLTWSLLLLGYDDAPRLLSSSNPSRRGRVHLTHSVSPAVRGALPRVLSFPLTFVEEANE